MTRGTICVESLADELKIEPSLCRQMSNRHPATGRCQDISGSAVSPDLSQPLVTVMSSSLRLRVRGRWGGLPESWQPDNGLLKTLFLQQGPQGEAVFLQRPSRNDSVSFGLTAVVNFGWMSRVCVTFNVWTGDGMSLTALAVSLSLPPSDQCWGDH